jgi:hypothetical protein
MAMPDGDETSNGEPQEAAAKAALPGAETPSNPESLKYLLGGAAVLQGILTAVGVSSGGISALVINDRSLVVSGFAAVLAAIFIGALVSALEPRGWRRKWSIGVGTILLFAGLGVTAYVALVGPAVAKAPSIDVGLTQSSRQLILTAHVKASGIAVSSQFWFEIDAREYVPGSDGGKYDPLGTPLYQNQLGADSQGDIDSTVTIPLPPGPYNVVSVEAWDGAHAGPCGSLQVEGGASLTQLPKKAPNEATKPRAAILKAHGRAGCVVFRLPAAPAAG